MNKIKVVVLLIAILFPTLTFAQLVGVGAQYVDPKGGENAIQFQANLSFPVWTKPNPLNVYMSSGIDYTGGSSPVSGINVKPIQLSSYISEKWFNESKVTFMVGADAGYLFNHRHGKNGIVLTPHVHVEYSIFYLKSGWDFNVTGHKDQFFIRFGVGIGLGTFKTFAKTRIR